MKNRHKISGELNMHAGLQHLICLGHQRHLSGDSGIENQGLMRSLTSAVEHLAFKKRSS